VFSQINFVQRFNLSFVAEGVQNRNLSSSFTFILLEASTEIIRSEQIHGTHSNSHTAAPGLFSSVQFADFHHDSAAMRSLQKVVSITSHSFYREVFKHFRFQLVICHFLLLPVKQHPSLPAKVKVKLSLCFSF
jgi:hypothetical protein